MEIKKLLTDAEKLLSNFRYLIGIAVVTLLIALIILTFQNFKKQNQIIEKGGFIDGKIKCVCNQKAWDEYMSEQFDMNLNSYIPNFNNSLNNPNG